MKQIFIAGTLFMLPMIASAQGIFEDGGGNLSGAGNAVLTLINDVLVPLVFGLALLFFLFGLLKAFVIKGDEDSRSDGKQYMLWGIAAMVVMVSVWAIVNLVSGALFGSNNETPPAVPNAPTTNT